MTANNTIELVVSLKDTASKGLSGISTAIGSLSKGVAAISAVAVTAATAIAGIAYATASAGEALRDMSLRVGVSVEALSSLKYAAELSGTSLEGLGQGLKFLSRNMYSASSGSKEASEVFRKLHLNITDASGGLRKADDVFMEAIDRINALGSETEKTALALELFGRGGTEILPLIKEGSAKIAEMRAEAEKLGLTFTTIEANQADAFKDALDKIKGSAKGLGFTFGKELLPLATEVMDKLADKISTLRPAIQQFAETFTATLAALPEIVVLVGNTIERIFVRVFTEPSYFKGFLSNFLTVMTSLSLAVAGTVATIAITIGEAAGVVFIPFYEAFRAIADKVRYYWEVIVTQLKTLMYEFAVEVLSKLNYLLPKALEIDTSGFKKSLDEINQTMVKLPITLDEAIADGGRIMLGMLSSLKDRLTGVAEYWQFFGSEAKGVFKDLADLPEMKQFSERLSQILEAAKKEVEALGTKFGGALEAGAKDGVKAAKSLWDELRDHIESTLITTKDLVASVWDNFQQSAGNAVTNVIVYGESLGEQLKALFQSVAASIVSSLVQIGVQKLALWVLSKGLGLAESTSKMAAITAETFGAAFASTAAIPIIGPELAPAVAAAATATMLAGASAASVTGAAFGATIGQAHAGLDDVPEDATYVLKKGERVLAPEQNKDLKKFLGGGGQPVSIGNFNFMPNASIDEALMSKSASWWSKVIEKKVVPALNNYGRRGGSITVKYRKPGT